MTLTSRDPHTAWETAKILNAARKYALCEKHNDTRGMAKWEKAADRITATAEKREEGKVKERERIAEQNSREARKAKREADRKDKQEKVKQLREARQHKARMDRAKGTKK
jgi:hypothetical protein